MVNQTIEHIHSFIQLPNHNAINNKQYNIKDQYNERPRLNKWNKIFILFYYIVEQLVGNNDDGLNSEVSKGEAFSKLFVPF